MIRRFTVQSASHWGEGRKIDAQSGCILCGDSRDRRFVWRALAQSVQAPLAAESPVGRRVRQAPSGNSDRRRARQLAADDVNAWLDGFMPYALGAGPTSPAQWSSSSRTAGPDRARLRLLGRRQARPRSIPRRPCSGPDRSRSSSPGPRSCSRSSRASSTSTPTSTTTSISRSRPMTASRSRCAT